MAKHRKRRKISKFRKLIRQWDRNVAKGFGLLQATYTAVFLLLPFYALWSHYLTTWTK